MAEKWERLSDFVPSVLWIECVRCKRRGEVQTDKARRRYGDITLTELARRVADAGGCALADKDNCVCSAVVVEPPVETWATLDDAWRGHWQGVLTCQRRLHALKRINSCVEDVVLDVHTLVAILGHKYPLEKLSRKAVCPQCGTEAASISWTKPKAPPDPGGTTEKASVLQFRPTRAVLGRKRFRLVSGAR